MRLHPDLTCHAMTATVTQPVEPFLFEPNGTLIGAMRDADQPDLINLAAGVPSPDILPGEELEEAAEAARRADGNARYAYHHPEGDHQLRALLAEVLQERGVDGVRGSDLLLTTGCSQGLNLAVSLLLQPGDIVACEVPTYYALLEMLSAAKVRLLPLPVDPHSGVDLEQVREALDRWKPRALFTCSSLANPTGATIPEADRSRLVEICRERGVPIVEDDIYSTLRLDGPLPPLRAFDDGQTVIYTSSFSKSVAPGLRLGYCLPGRWQEAFATRKCQRDMHGSPLTEAIMREFLRAGMLQPHLARLRRRFGDLTRQACEVIGAHFPAGTELGPAQGNYMLWVRLPHEVDFSELRRLSLAEKIIYCPGRIFYPFEPAQRDMRLNCAKAAPDELLRGLAILGDIAANLEPLPEK